MVLLLKVSAIAVVQLWRQRGGMHLPGLSKKKTCQPEEVLDSEPRDADRLDQREDWVLDRGLAFKDLTFKICL